MLESGQICYSIKPDLENLRLLRPQLKLALKLGNLSASKQRAYLVSITEWITNLIKHAQITADEILIELVFHQDDFNISIKDNGSPFASFDNIIQNKKEVNIKETLPESGLGLYLIKQAFPNVEYSMKKGPNDSYNILSLNAEIQTKVSSHKPTIAVIEDNPSVCQLIALYLQNDYEVNTFYNGIDFLAGMQNLHIDLVISDITMPKMDGLELRRRLAISPETHLIPFIFLTSSTDIGIENRANELGIDDFIHKPVNKQQLHSVIKRVLKRKQADRAEMSDILDKKVTAALRPELPPIINNYQCAMTSRHAAAGGGDFIVHLQREKQNFIILGDVMGHGINAKFFAHVYAGYIQGLVHSLSDADNISTVLNRLSSLIQRDVYLESVIVTCLGIGLEADGKIHIANAGHPKPIIISKNGIEEVDISGMLPGLEENPHYESKTIEINDKRLFIYTDGFIEVGSTAQDKQTNQNKLFELLHTTSRLPLKKANKAICQNFEALAGEPPPDDATFILISTQK